jgi:hypothetical protein
MIQLADRVKELSYTVGTGNLSLEGPVAGFNSFSSNYKYNDYLFYAVTDGTSYEVGSGQYILNGSTNTLRRFPVKSSNNNQAVNFPVGLKEVYVTYPATHSVYNGSGISTFNIPRSSGVAFWSTPNILNYDSNFIWDSTNERLGIRKSNPQYAIDVGGSANQSSIQASGFYVGKSGIYFPLQNNNDISYSGGRQLVHFEPNQLGDANINAIIQLSGNINNTLLLKKQNAGLVFAGPPSGCVPPCSPGLPSFRLLQLQDIPDAVALSGTLRNAIDNSTTKIFNSGINRILISDGTTSGITARSNLYFSGTNSNTLNLISITGVSNQPTLIIGGDGLSSLSGNPSASFKTNGRLLVMKEDQVFFEINSTTSTIDILSGARMLIGGIDVSLSGHNHISSDITDFSSSVSGLLTPLQNSIIADSPSGDNITYGRKNRQWIDITTPANLQIRRGTLSEINQIIPLSGEPVWATDTKTFSIGDEFTYGGIPIGLQDSKNYILCRPHERLSTRYNLAKSLTPNGNAKSSSNRATLFVFPGIYYESGVLNINADFVDIIGLGSIKKNRGCECSVYIPSGIYVDNKDVRLIGLETNLFNLATPTPLLLAENCKANASYSFGNAGLIAGTFINCESSANLCFGTEYCAISGLFTNCKSQNYSFGTDLSSLYKNSKFINCEAGEYSFGSQNGETYSTFENCEAKDYSFGGAVVASGTYINCVGGSGSFGSSLSSVGNFYYCRLTTGNFPTPLAPGKYRYCIDGYGNGYDSP